MTELEFLVQLRQALHGLVPENEIENQLQYYREYIRDAKDHGRSEGEIIEELGDPRLLAKTLADSFQRTHPGGDGKNTESGESTKTGEEGAGQTYYYGERKGRLSETWGRIVGLCVLVVVLIAAFAIGGSILGIVFRFLPWILAIWIVYRVIRGRRGDGDQ